MKNAMQLKAAIKKIAQAKNISAQLVLQNFMLERLLERIEKSQYNTKFILKGGLLIASMLGLNARATMDMDATLKGLSANEKNIYAMFKEICSINLGDDTVFSLASMEEIREKSNYGGYRVSFDAKIFSMTVPLKVDITTGDKITPREIKYEYKLLLENRSINVFAYNIETLLAEKLETVISRGDQNTRPRDYYDIYVLLKLQRVDLSALRAALNATAQERGSVAVLKNYREIIAVVQGSENMKQRWLNYQKDFDYAANIRFEDTCEAVLQAMAEINKK